MVRQAVEFFDKLRAGGLPPESEPAPPPVEIGDYREKQLAGLGRISTRIFAAGVDDDEYYELRARLRFTKPPSGMSRGELADELDLAEDRWTRAHELAVNARYALDAYEADMAATDADLRNQALADLTGEKESGQRRKAIAEKDIDSKVAELFHDEARERAHVRSKLRLAVKHLDHLVEAWKSRARHLEVLVQGAR